MPELATGPITDEEVMWLRHRRRQEADATRARKLLIRWGFHGSWLLATLWGAYVWFINHITVKIGQP